MNRTLFFGGLLLSLLGTVGCACFAPSYTYRPHGGGMGVNYVDGGPCAGNADCGGYQTQAFYGPQFGYYGSGDCSRCIGNGLRIIGEGAVGLVAAPFVLVGSLFNCGAYATYHGGCGCSNEVYYGDNCYQPHDFCDPCAGIGSGAYLSGGSGCAQCNGGHSGSIQSSGQPIRQTSAMVPMGRQPNAFVQRPMFVR